MSKEPYPSETADRFIVRFPERMRDRIKDAAATNNRSMNSEIIARLEASFHAPPPGGLFGLATPQVDVQSLMDQMKKLESHLNQLKIAKILIETSEMGE